VKGFHSHCLFGCHLNLQEVTFVTKYLGISLHHVSYFQPNYTFEILCAGRKVHFKDVMWFWMLMVLKEL